MRVLGPTLLSPLTMYPTCNEVQQQKINKEIVHTLKWNTSEKYNERTHIYIGLRPVNEQGTTASTNASCAICSNCTYLPICPTYLFAQGAVHLFGDARGHSDCSQAPRLADDGLAAARGGVCLEQELRNLSSLTATGLTCMQISTALF
jgi:hypothetical protein